MVLNLVSDGQFFSELAQYLLCAPAPVFLSRAGGSDTTAVIAYRQAKASGDPAALRHAHDTHKPVTERYNGYYDKSNLPDRYFQYCDLLADLYYSADYLFFSNPQLLSLRFKESLGPSFYQEEFPYKSGYLEFLAWLESRPTTITCFPYQFIEKIVFDEHTLFRVLGQSLPGKKVLVISPFARSIEENFKNRHGFFKKNYAYPEFTLRLYNTPVTYSGLPDEFYPEHDWFETLARMKRDIAEMDFDVALLSCGSYAMPLGDFIARNLHKKAIYVGGVLQLYFGVMGRRYNNPYFLDQINLDKYIYPVERESFMQHVTLNDQTPREAFGAYF